MEVQARQGKASMEIFDVQNGFGEVIDPPQNSNFATTLIAFPKSPAKYIEPPSPMR